MNLIDYTHPLKVPALYLPVDRRSDSYYLRLNELPPGHAYHSHIWSLFRYPDWLEGGSAWVQGKAIYDDMERYASEQGVDVTTLRPVIGSNDPQFDEAVGQALLIYGVKAMVAELIPRKH
ncbi:hypothetical protein [Comamonas thiooxydans]|uniref:hypothetical protein n=1 Tax=Comamonas thiooxydans TaxID=363952 RepID=UPI000B408BF3|nr:hypothetical protein [Comamonas thiooxydans]